MATGTPVTGQPVVGPQAAPSATVPPIKELDLTQATDKSVPSGGVETIREQTAARIATVLVWGFLILLGIPLLYLAFVFALQPGNAAVDEPLVVDMIKTLAAILSGIVASVVAYYFGTQRKLS